MIIYYTKDGGFQQICRQYNNVQCACECFHNTFFCKYFNAEKCRAKHKTHIFIPGKEIM